MNCPMVDESNEDLWRADDQADSYEEDDPVSDDPHPVEFHRVLPGTVATWLADIERYKAANARLLAALKEARTDVFVGTDDPSKRRTRVAHIDAVIEAETT